MVNIGDWLKRTEEPLAGKPPFDWHDFSIAQVVQKEKDYVQVKFACNCMTFDGTDSRTWYNGEYIPLDKKSYLSCKKTHDECCLFDKELEIDYAS